MRPDQHGGEQGADRREADRSRDDQGRDKPWSPPDRRVEQQHHDRHDDDLHAGHQRDEGDELAEVDRAAFDGREQERPKRLAFPLALERAAQGQRPGERERDPHDTGGRVFVRSPLSDKANREDQNYGEGEEERRVDELTAARLDDEILARHEPCRAKGLDHSPALRIAARYRSRSVPPASGRDPARPSRRYQARLMTRSALSKSCVAITTMAPASRTAVKRAARATQEESSRPVKGSSRRIRRGPWRIARSRASRCRMPREKLDTRSSARSSRRAAASAACARAATSSRPYRRPKNAKFSRAVRSA